MSRRRHLPRPIADAMQHGPDPARLQRMWSGVRDLRARRARRLTMMVRGAIAAAAAVALLAVGYQSGHGGVDRAEPQASLSPLAIASQGGALPTHLEGPLALRLDDGSEVDLRSGEMEVVENGATDFVLMLTDGAADFRVRPHTGRAWWIESGLATVRVVGTRFELVRTAGRLLVRVEEGTVAVRSSLIEGGVQILRGGEQLELTEPAPETPARPSASNSVASNSVASNSVASSSVASSSTVPAPTDAPPNADAAREGRAAWRALADRGDYERAWRALGDDGIRRRAPVASPSELLALADVARRSGHDAAAIAPLRRLLAHHPGEPDAALGAFTLGRIHHQLGDPRAAAGAFERALELRLPASLRGDATARLAQARSASGQTEGARASAESYLRGWPEGPQADAMRELAASR